MTKTLDPFDDLAALFLTDGGPATQTKATTEIVVAGHLPVRGGLWLAPYADSVARTAGPTSLIRLDHAAPIVQIFRGPNDLDAPKRGAWRDILTRAAPVTRRWIVRPAYDTTAARLIEAGADRITILSSADDVAVVAAYRVIRELAAAAEKKEQPLPPLGVAVIGAADEAARRMLDALNRTARAFLGLELPLVGTVARMDADLRLTSDFHANDDDTPDLTELISVIATAAPAPTRGPTHGAANGSSPVTMSPPPLPKPEPKPETPDREQAPESPIPVVTTASETFLHQTRRSEPRQITMRMPPKPASVTEPKPTAEVEPQRDGQPVPLAEHAGDMLPVEIRMPGHERIELAFDGDGRLHLLGRGTDLRELAVVRSWAWAHRELLSMACRALRLQSARDVVSHLFTETPVDVEDLHGGDVQLHVLAPVKVGSRTGWYAASLNRPSTFA